MPKITLNNVTVADAYMALLADRGIDYWFANAGTDFAPVVETLAKAQVLETKVPTPGRKSGTVLSSWKNPPLLSLAPFLLS